MLPLTCRSGGDRAVAPGSGAGRVMQGKARVVRIEGDAAWRCRVNWLVDHLRWDVEEDLARLMGDAPAPCLHAGGARPWLPALRQFVARR